MYMPVTYTSPNAAVWGRYRGMGDAESTVKQAGGLATPVLTGALAAHAAATAAATGSAATILGMSPALAIPVIGAAMVGVTIAVIGLMRLAQGCGQTCVVTSQWANQAEDLLKQNLAAYMALPTPRPKSAQNTGISNFNVVMAQLAQLCGQPGTADAGRRCISDRQRGACVWHDAAGQCWNWYVGYLDPIANDPNVAPDSVSSQVSGVFNQVASAASSPTGALLLLAGAGLLLWGLS